MINTIKKKIGLKQIKIFLFFIYLLSIYILEGDPEYRKYSRIILMLFSGLELITIIKKRELKNSIPILMLFAFSFFGFLSTFWALDSGLALSRSATIFSLVAFLLISYNFFTRIDNGQDVLLKIIMWAEIVFSIYIIMYYGIEEYFNKLIQGERIGTEINNVNIIGAQISVAVMIAFFFGLYQNKKYFALSLIPLVVSLGTGSKKVIVAIAIGIFLIFIFKLEGKITAKRLLKIAIIVILLAIIILQLPIFSNIIERFEKMVNYYTGQGETDSSTRRRMVLLEMGIEQFFKTPILGAGIANSQYITKQATRFSVNFHNNFVELLATTGIIGFSLYYSVYIYVIINCIKLLKRKDKYINIVLTIFLISLLLDFGGVFYCSKNIYIYFLLGIITIENISQKKLMNKIIKYVEKPQLIILYLINKTHKNIEDKK